MEPNQIVLDIEAKSAGLYIAQPDRLATLFLLGGFVQPRRFESRPYSWSEHREWVITNSNRDAESQRRVSTGWQHQVYVVNTTYAETEMSEHPYICRRIMPFGDDKKFPLFHKGFVCAGYPGNNSYYTALRPEDGAAESIQCMNEEILGCMHEETFGVKLYFFDKRRFKKDEYISGKTDIMLTARVRKDEVIGFRSIVRTNAYFTGGHGSFTKCDLSYRGYEKDTDDWKVKRWFPDCFDQSRDSQERLADEARYHNSVHLLVYRAITKTVE